MFRPLKKGVYALITLVYLYSSFDISSGRVLQKIHICSMAREDQEWLIQEF